MAGHLSIQKMTKVTPAPLVRVSELGGLGQAGGPQTLQEMPYVLQPYSRVARLGSRSLKGNLVGLAIANVILLKDTPIRETLRYTSTNKISLTNTFPEAWAA